MKRFFGVVLLLALGSSALADVSAANGWVRLLPPSLKTTAGYFDITSSEADRLLSASSPDASMVELHQTSMQEGVMSMSRVDSVEIAAGQTVSFSPGGYHLMVMGLRGPLSEGKIISVILNFERAGAVRVELPAQDN